MTNLISFNEAITDSEIYSKRHLILGNGFSIGYFPNIFHYSSLYDKANFSNISEVEKVFEVINSKDFEAVIKALNDTAKIIPIYVPNTQKNVQKIEKHAEDIKGLLIKTISDNHPKHPSEIQESQYHSCKKFFNYFLEESNTGQVYTLNYDLLLYWVLMHSNLFTNIETIKLNKNDGFGNVEDEFDNSYVVWQGQANKAGQQRVHYLHGALHLFDSGDKLKKYTWRRSGISLIKQICQSLESNEFPFFIYGHSLAENDDHILNKISKGKFPKLYIGLYGDKCNQANKFIIQQAKKLANLRNKKYPLGIFS